jgi:polysaccharide chain length determinant protein (PEP-CTERM system associated)
MLPGREYGIDSIVKLLLAKRWLLIVPLFLGVLGGLLFSRSQPDLYRSDALIQVVPQRVPDDYVRSTVTERVEDRLRALTQQVLSRTQLERLIVEFNLYPAEREKQPMEDVVAHMTTRVSIQPVVTATAARREEGADAFRVSFDHEDPRTAQKVVEKLASFFIDTNARDRGNQADQTSEFLNAQLTDARTRLEAQEKKLERFREINAGRLPTQMQSNMQAIQNTQLALQAMVESAARDRDRKLVLERLYNDAAADASAGAPAAVSGTAPGGLAGLQPGATPQQQLDAARTLLGQLELKFTPKHPDVLKTKRLVADLERQVAADETRRPLSAEAAPPPATPEEARRRDRLREMRAELESLDRQIAFKEAEERRLRAQIGTYQSRLEAVPGIESEWIALTRDYDTLQATYRELLSKSENSKMAASLEQRQIGEQFRLLDPARVPERPFSPNRIRINALGTLAGLGLGLLLLGLGEVRDTTMRNEMDVVGALDLPVLIAVPYVTNAADRRRQQRRRLLTSVAALVVCVATGALVWYLRLWQYVL